jgi:hypothetical protein
MKSYEDGTLTQSVQQVQSLYGATHPLFKQWTDDSKNQSIIESMILNNIGNQKSMWIDSFGHGLSPNFISIEQNHYSTALENLSNVYFRKELNNIKTYQELVQTFNPEIVVYYKSEFFKYLTLPELIGKITELSRVYTKLIIYTDLMFMDYNKLKYPIENLIIQITDQIPEMTVKRHGLFEILINI